MKLLRDKILSLSKQYHQDVISWRRHIHAHPELSMQEFKTAEYVAARLKEFGIPYEKGIAKTGIVGLIRGKNPEKKTVALRADMDALPILESNDVE